MEPFSRFHQLPTLDPSSPHPRRAGSVKRLTCLLTPLPRGKGLSLALVRLLSDELPDIRFTLDAREDVDAIWICGYGERATPVLSRLRARHPSATIVVTGRATAGSWERAVIAAGADHACSWPVDYSLLGLVLHRAHVKDEHVSSGILELGRAGT